ncbi:MAG: RsiV family protein [Ferruginibacter sp.]
MQLPIAANKMIITILAIVAFSTTAAQSADGWYKVFTGNMGTNAATLHLHKSAKSYNGYLWFLQNQCPLQLYYNESLKKSDSIILSAGSGTIRIMLSGILNENSFSGTGLLSNNNGVPTQAAFVMRVDTQRSFTPFNYYYTEGFAKLPLELKNQSDCHYVGSSVWPINNSSSDEAFRNETREMLGIKNVSENVGRFLIDEKNRCISTWKKERGKISLKEASDMGLSLTLQEEVFVLVMFENEKYITLANYNTVYNGGAHKIFATTLATFNKHTGKKLKLSDVLNTAGIQQLPALLEKVARAQYNIKNSKPLNKNGFIVQRIKANPNFYVTGNGIGFVYPPASIKAFDAGEINLLVPFAEFKNYLQPNIITKR